MDRGKMMEENRKEYLMRDDTGKYHDDEFDGAFLESISEVCQALQEAGFVPYDQLTGYVRTGNDQYITRRRNARKIVTEMDPQDIAKYLRRAVYSAYWIVADSDWCWTSLDFGKNNVKR